MENIPPTLGVEDGITEVECLLVELQAQSNTAIAHEGGNIFSGEVHDVMHTGTEICYIQLQNDFCNMGDDFFLGVEFAESITYLDHGSSEGLHASVSNSLILTSGADTDLPWKSDCPRIMEVPEYQPKISSSGFSEICSCHGEESFVEENSLKSPTSSSVQNIGEFQDVWSSCSFHDVFPDVNDRSLSPSDELFCSSKILENDKWGVMTQDLDDYQIHEEDSLTMTAAHVIQTDALPALKRPRKATQRAIRLPAEESSVRAIQVPFGSLGQKESPKKHAFDVVPKQGAMDESKEYCATREKKKKWNSTVTTIHQKKRDNFTMATVKRKGADCVTEAHPAETDDYDSEACLKTRDDHSFHKINPKERDFHVAVSLQKRDVCFRAARHKKKDNCYSTKSPEEVIHQRKHHRLWTISEVRKLIDGVSQYGVGRWSRIKKLFFPRSVHRTPVDIKDKWRNLLKASGIQEQNKRQIQGEKRRNMAWRPLPKPILRRVCELAIMHPYPKGPKPKIVHHHRISSDGSTDITLRDYIRIIRSVNGN